MLRASIILCAHNPRSSYIRRVLDALPRQGLSLNTWELLLVDNASNIALQTIYDISWHPNGRHIRENKLGLAYARQRGIDDSRSELFVFLDDDTVLDDNYLAAALKIREAWPELGVWGSGSVAPEFEIEPPNYLNPLIPYLAIRSNPMYWSNIPTCYGSDATPYGAGLCVRPDVAAVYSQSLRQSDIRITGRQGKSHLSSEDIELEIISCNMGLGVAVFPELRLTHLIPKERIAEDYL